MLQHEQTDPPVSPTAPLPIPNAADARVTPDELNAALKALEDRQNSTVAIGSVVDELRLNATPEQIWDEVQQQRAQVLQTKAAQDAEQSKVTVRVTVNGQSVAQSPAAARRRVRTWRDIKGWIWVLFWCSGGLGLITSGLHLVSSGAPVSQTITISGDSGTQPINVQGKNVVISGDRDTITLQGTAKNVEIDGDFDTVTGDAPQSYVLSGERDIVHFKAAATSGKPAGRK